ncbi:hypothetical protein [Actinoplanes sp. NPDC049681]|uniref:hypothetical protein n=1 Tax=Actinoplanes sp. NPDC049681 TaxID=3363905 RepID=UPI00378D1183
MDPRVAQDMWGKWEPLRRRWPLWVALGIVVVAAPLVALGWFRTPHTATAPPERPLPPALTVVEGQRLADDLLSGSPEQVARAVVVPHDAKVPPSTAAELHRLRSVAFDVATFAVGTDRTASVEGTVVDARGGRHEWQFYLVEAGSRWIIAQTVPAS